MSLTSPVSSLAYTQTSVGQTFAVSFYILASADIGVIRTRAGVDTPLVLNTDYTVANAGTNPSTATITMVAGAVSDIVTIYRNAAITQPSTYVSNDRFPASTQETNMDRMTMQIQQLALKVVRAFRLPVTMAETAEFAKSTWKGKMFGFDTNGIPTPSDPLGAASLTGSVIEVTSYAALRLVSVTGMATGRQAITLGYSSGPDGGEGIWKYDSSSVRADNNGTVIAPSVGSGRWLRLYSSAVNVKWFGARGNGATDDTVAFLAAIAEAALGVGVVTVPPAVYVINSRYAAYNDGTTTAGDIVGIPIPSNMVLIGYGATLQSVNTNSDHYSILASYGTSNVHIKGLKLIGDRDTNTTVGGEHGFGIDFRDVTDCSVEDVISNKMWGDGFYLGVLNTAGTGSNRVTYRNIQATSCRRQGLSITGGQNITVDGYRFMSIDGTIPMAGIDIEPNTSAFCFNIRLLNGYTEACRAPIIVYKTKSLIIDQLQVENCIHLFPQLSDRVYDFSISNVICRAGATSTYGILWQDAPTLVRGRISNFHIDGSSVRSLVVTEPAAADWLDVVFSNGTIVVADSAVQTALVDIRTTGTVVFENIRYVIPAGFSAADAVSLTANSIIDAAGARWRGCEFINKGTVAAASLLIDLGQYGNQGCLFDKIDYTRDAFGMANGWIAAAGHEAPHYIKSLDGVVRLFGNISSGTVTDGTLIGTLPVGFRPKAACMFGVCGRDGGANISSRAVTLNTDGTIVCTGDLVNNRVDLGSIEFLAYVP